MIRKRLGLIDVLRLISVASIFLFHSNIHIGCSYFILTPFISMSAIFMTAFFVISGFSIYYANSEINGFYDRKSLYGFYKKRIANIMPMYWFMVVTYPIWEVLVYKGSFINSIILAPIEILGLQSVFHSIFGYTHNGGTWFVSCILFCYLVFPIVYTLIKETSVKIKVASGIMLSFILLYSPFLTVYLKIEGIYGNIFFRILEFIIGVIICSIWFDVRECKWYKRFLANRIFFVGIFLLLILLVTFGVKANIRVGDYMAYNLVAVPCFSMLVFSGAGIDTPIINSSRVIKYAVSVSYAFFFAQFYTWKTTLVIIERIGMDTNFVRFVVSLVVCSVISILMHEVVEKPIKRHLEMWSNVS